MNYKLGDKVIIKECKEMNKWGEFQSLIGKEMTISQIYDGEKIGEFIYLLNENVFMINFIEECFAPKIIKEWRGEL